MTTRVDDVSAPRHTPWYRFMYSFLLHVPLPIIRRKLHVKAERTKLRPADASMITYNHGCHFDFITVNHIMPVYTRTITTDAIIRKRLPRMFLPIMSDFIFRRKGQKADAVVESVNLTIADGICVHLAPEGNVTQNGATDAVRPRTGRMIKDSGAGLVTIRLAGNYLNSPFWARNKSKGPVYGELVNIYSKEDIAKLTPEEINDLIEKDIYINHYEWNREKRIVYDRQDRAECMERVAYMCPKCGKIGHMHSSHDTLSCGACGYSADVDEYGFFVGEDIIFDNLYDWDMWQKEQLSAKMDGWRSSGEDIITFDHVKIQYMDGENPVIVSPDASISISADRVAIKGEGTDMEIPLADIISFNSLFSDTMGMNYGGRSYQIRSHVPVSNRVFRDILKIVRG